MISFSLLMAACGTHSPALQSTAQSSINTSAESQAAASDSTVSSQATQFVTKWSDAFIARDGETILDYCSDDAKKSLSDAGVLKLDGKYYSFGFSSPWPWGNITYRISAISDDSADILYYAVTSIPDLYVWHEHIQFAKNGDDYQITEETLDMDDIASAADFDMRYPNGQITGTGGDYYAQDMAESIAQHFKEGNLPEAGDLSDPVTAAKYLLHLSSCEATLESSTDDSAELTLTFTDGSRQIKMQREDTIWLPATAEQS